MGSTPFRYVFIDWYRTLSTSLFWGHREDLGGLGASLFSPAGGLHSLLVPWMRGGLTSEEVVRAIAEAADYPRDIAMREFILSCRRMTLVSDEVPGLVTALRSRGIKVAIATDNMDCFRRWTVPSLGLDILFDAILCSSQLRALKSDWDDRGRSLFFHDFLEREGIGRGESVLIDDSPDIGDRLERSGIVYRRIQPDTGLVPALRRLLAE